MDLHGKKNKLLFVSIHSIRASAKCSSAAIKFGVKLLLSITLKKSFFFPKQFGPRSDATFVEPHLTSKLFITIRFLIMF